MNQNFETIKSSMILLGQDITNYETLQGKYDAAVKKADDLEDQLIVKNQELVLKNQKIVALEKEIEELKANQPEPEPEPEPEPQPQPQPSKFLFLDSTRFPGDPDLGIKDNPMMYQSSFWPSGTDVGSDTPPNPTYIENTAVPRFMTNNPDLDLLIMDIENWKLTNPSGVSPNAEFAKRLQWHIDVVKAVKRKWTKKVAYYGEIPPRTLYGFDSATSLATWEKTCDMMKPLVDVVDVLVPSCYLTLGSTKVTDPNAQIRYIQGMIKGAKRISQGKPVYGASWIAWDVNHTYLDYATMTRVLKAMKDAGADGVVLWSMAGGSPNFDSSKPWYKAVMDFRRSLTA